MQPFADIVKRFFEKNLKNLSFQKKIVTKAEFKRFYNNKKFFIKKVAGYKSKQLQKICFYV